MGGPFASAALDLHGHGLAPIPLGGAGGKVPLVKHKDRRPFGQAALSKFTTRYPTENIGILTGPSSLTVVDIDNPALAEAMLARFGKTPLQVQTPSGGVHQYYRSSGELSTNLRSEGLAVDIKGLGGMVVAPPSIRPSGAYKGRPYAFITGDWSDVARLPTIHGGSLDQRQCSGNVARVRSVGVGKRNNTLFRLLLRQARNCDDIEALQDVAATIVASRLEHHPNTPFTLAEIDKTVRSVWTMESEGRNWIGQGPHVTFSHQELSTLMCNPDAMCLVSKLRMAHAARAEPFAVSPKAMETHGSIPGWGRRRYQHARDALLKHGFLICVHEGGRRPGDAYLYELAARR